MAETDDYPRMLLDQATAEEAFLGRVGCAEDIKPNGIATVPATNPALSLVITSRQRLGLRELSFSDEAIRHMPPAETHQQLGLNRFPLDLGSAGVMTQPAALE